MPRRPPSDAFPDPAGSAGAAHFAGASSLARARRAEALRARAEDRPPRPIPAEVEGRDDGARARAGGRRAGTDGTAPRAERTGDGSAPRAAGERGAGGARAGSDARAPRAERSGEPSVPVAARRRDAGAPADGARPLSRAAGEGGAPGGWPRPPACLTAAQLDLPPTGARVTVCGLVIVRQRPGSAKGVLFVTLEDETGVVNVVVWARVYEAARRAVLAARLMRVTGRVQREGAVVHVVAETIEDVSHLLDRLTAAPDRPLDPALARADEVARPSERGSRPAGGWAAARAQGLIRGAAPRALHPREQARLLFRRPADPAAGGPSDGRD